MKKTIAASLLTITLSASAATTTPLWMRYARISPDGKHIAFTYKGDIFTVPAAGGTATRITSQDSYETTPIWSPDSKTLAFASDRYGNFDIFTVDATRPGQWTRLTYNSAKEMPEAFTPDGKAVLFSASIQDPAASALFPSGRMTELYSVPVSGGAPVQILGTPANALSWAPDGKSFLYQDVKGFENTWRKHHTSSVTRDIVRYTPATGTHTPVVTNPGEDLDPIDAGETIYFLSERAPQKSLNVYSAPAAHPEQAKAITNFKKHPVRFLSRATDGTLSFTYDGELYTLVPGGKPSKVAVTIDADFPDEKRSLTASRGAREGQPSPDGKQIAFTYRGDVYVTSVEYGTTKQISDTPEAERHPVWADDSTLYYTTEREGRANIYRATFDKSADEPDFAHATVIREEPVFKADSHERIMPDVSPDGKQLAFILDRNKLAVMDLKSKNVRQLTDGSTYRSRSGGFTYTWSPDSRWIALEIVDRKHDPYTDVAILNVADGTITNITNSGYFDASPKWIMDGNAIAFESERYGMRNHASWGSMTDIFFVFLNQDAYDRFTLSKEEREILDKKTEQQKKADKASDKDSKDKDKKKDGKDSDSTEPIKVELAGISDRQVRITPMSTELIDAIVDADGKSLYFLSSADGGDAFAWEYKLDDQSLSMLDRLSDPGRFAATPDGKNIFLVGSSFRKFPKGKSVSFRAEKLLDPAAERAYMLDYVEREEGERFYVKDMHGIDWKSMCADYRKFLPHIANNYDFSEMLSELLGELNVSHTGSGYRASSSAQAPEHTAALGALYDLTYTGKGVRIAEILEDGPLSRVRPVLQPGTIIESINGQEITTDNPIDRLLTNTARKRTRITVKDTDGNRHDLVVRPISSQGGLMYDRWVKQRAHDVDSLSHGRLGYVHLSAMDDDSFRKAYSDMLGKYNDREGIVIDIRWNGGGRLHEDIEVLLSGKKYFTQEIRGDETCDMPSRRWNKPSIMLMSEACYSNAHGTPWVYKHRELGRLVGMPVPGTMTSVNWVTLQDPSLYFGIPVVGYRLADGSFLENKQLEPDVRVANDPAVIVTGTDQQLREAVEQLLREIDSAK